MHLFVLLFYWYQYMSEFNTFREKKLFLDISVVLSNTVSFSFVIQTKRCHSVIVHIKMATFLV